MVESIVETILREHNTNTNPGPAAVSMVESSGVEDDGIADGNGRRTWLF